MEMNTSNTSSCVKQEIEINQFMNTFFFISTTFATIGYLLNLTVICVFSYHRYQGKVLLSNLIFFIQSLNDMIVLITWTLEIGYDLMRVYKLAT